MHQRPVSKCWPPPTLLTIFDTASDAASGLLLLLPSAHDDDSRKQVKGWTFTINTSIISTHLLLSRPPFQEKRLSSVSRVHESWPLHQPQVNWTRPAPRLTPGHMHKGSFQPASATPSSHKKSHFAPSSPIPTIQSPSEFLCHGSFPGCVACVSKGKPRFCPAPLGLVSAFAGYWIRAWPVWCRALAMGAFRCSFYRGALLSSNLSAHFRAHTYRQVKGTGACERLSFFGICCVSPAHLFQLH